MLRRIETDGVSILSFTSIDMRFLILGATGPAGILLVRKTLEVYPQSTVVVYARSPQKLPEDITNHASVTVIQGQLDDSDTFSTALQGVDVVLSALGPGYPHPANTPIANGYKALVKLMREQGIKRLIALGTPSIPDPNDKSTLTFRLMVKTVKTLAPTAYADIVAVGEVIRGEGADLEWTLARVPLLTNGDSEEVSVGYLGEPQVYARLARKGFAAFVVKEVEERKWVRASPALSTP